nr:hypothetical protein [Candidatus Anoxychlamydiales bacterium]
KPNIIINNSVPLSEDQANLYMTTAEYQRYLGISITNLTQYKSAEGNFKSFFWKNRTTNKIRQPSKEELRKHIGKIKPNLMNRHFIILRTKGIEKLPKNTGSWFEYDQTKERILFCGFFVLIFPYLCCCYCEDIKDFRFSSPYKNIPTVKRKVDDNDICDGYQRSLPIINEPNLD